MPLTLFEPVHVSGIQIDFANESFGFPGEAFVAQIGTDARLQGLLLQQVLSLAKCCTH
jgi:hypothetical protein